MLKCHRTGERASVTTSTMEGGGEGGRGRRREGKKEGGGGEGGEMGVEGRGREEGRGRRGEWRYTGRPEDVFSRAATVSSLQGLGMKLHSCVGIILPRKYVHSQHCSQPHSS